MGLISRLFGGRRNTCSAKILSRLSTNRKPKWHRSLARCLLTSAPYTSWTDHSDPFFPTSPIGTTRLDSMGNNGHPDAVVRFFVITWKTGHIHSASLLPSVVHWGLALATTYQWDSVPRNAFQYNERALLHVQYEIHFRSIRLLLRGCSRNKKGLLYQHELLFCIEPVRRRGRNKLHIGTNLQQSGLQF